MYTIFVTTVRGCARPERLSGEIRRYLSNKLKISQGDELQALLPALREATQTFLSGHPEKANVKLITMQGVGILWPLPLVSDAV